VGCWAGLEEKKEGSPFGKKRKTTREKKEIGEGLGHFLIYCK
jgi:hypothetical protein